MIFAKPMLIAAALGAACPCNSASAQVQPEIQNTYCELFLRYLGTNAGDYVLFRSFLLGYLAARPGFENVGVDPDKTTALMSSVADYCRGHANEDFPSAIAAVLKK